MEWQSAPQPMAKQAVVGHLRTRPVTVGGGRRRSDANATKSWGAVRGMRLPAALMVCGSALAAGG